MMARAFTSILAIAWTTTAFAQAAPDAKSVAPVEEGAEAAGSQGDNIIIVTAQRRSERLVDVPISITAVTPDQIELAGPESLENLTKAAPGVYMQRAVYGLSPTIRGVGSTLGGNVAVYVDGVNRPTETGNIFDLASVSGIEILKGPQGTLFGVNATGGALLIKTLDPGFDLAGRLNFSFERFNQVRSSAYVNVPINDKIAVNGSVAYRYSRGYIRDLRTNVIVNEGSNFTARGKILFQPTDNFSVILTAAHAEFDDPTGASFQAIASANLFNFPGVDTGPVARDRYHLSHNRREVIKTTTDEYSAGLKLELDAGTISAITAYQKNDLYSQGDLDATYATQPALIPLDLGPPVGVIVIPIPTDGFLEQQINARTFSQELNFTSKDGEPFTYVAGLYYASNEARVPILRSSGVPLFNAFGGGKTYAAYAEGTYQFSDLSLFAGIRYTHQKQFGKYAGGVDAPSPWDREQTDTENNWTPRVGVRYALAPNANIYATYSQGVKSGRFDISSLNGPAVKSEKLEAFEVGFKSSSQLLTLSASAFYYNYKDLQVSTVISGGGGAILTQYFNVPKSRIYGADVDAMLRFSDAFDLRLSAAYTHARYIDFASAPGYTDDPAVPGTVFGLLLAGVPVNANGNKMIRAPEYTASVTLGYHADLGGGDRLDLAVSPYYSSRIYFDFANELSQKPYVTVDASATLTLDERVRVSLFGRNLTDKTYYNSLSTNAYGTYATFAMPRTYGVSIGYSF